MLRALACSIVVCTAACGGDDRGAADAGHDAASADGGSRGDGGSDDGGSDDGGSDDAGTADGGIADAGAYDAGVPALRLLSLNLHCLSTEGTPFETNAARLAAIAERATSDGAEVMLLQEVCDDGTTDALATLESELEARTGAAWASALGPAHVAWEGTPMEAMEGVAVLARGSLADVQVLAHVAQGGLRRVAVFATLESGLRVGSFHLDHLDAATRTEQARELAAMALLSPAAGANVLLGGDLNDREGSAAHTALLDAGFVDASDPLRATRIDHVFVHRGASTRAEDAALIFTAASEQVSDHPGVLVTLAGATPAPVLRTTFVAHADVGFGHRLTIRGDHAPLSWDRGMPLVNLAPDEWRWATTELTTPFAFKLLRDDTDYQIGPDQPGSPGGRHEVTPSF